MSNRITNGCTGKISAVIFCAKIRTKSAIKNLLGEPGVEAVEKSVRKFFRKINRRESAKSRNIFC